MALKKVKTNSFVVDDAHAGRRLDQFLAQALSEHVSRTGIQKVIREKGVQVNGHLLRRFNAHLKSGDKVAVDLEEASRKRPLKAEKLEIDVVYEDDDLLIVNKKAGMVVHPSPGHWSGTLVNALLGSGRKLSGLADDRPGIVHRLDKDTTGLLVVAKNTRAPRRLSRMWRARTVRKTYYAIVSGKVAFQRGIIETPIGRDPKQRTKMAIKGNSPKEALTEYRVLERLKYSTYLEINIPTGRTHQIRVHLTHLGHPVLGDAVYGRAVAGLPLCLHAGVLEFAHPTSGEPLVFKAPLPEAFTRVLEEERKR